MSDTTTADIKPEVTGATIRRGNTGAARRVTLKPQGRTIFITRDTNDLGHTMNEAIVFADFSAMISFAVSILGTAPVIDLVKNSKLLSYLKTVQRAKEIDL